MDTKGILSMPIEIRCAILRELPTVEDISSAVRSTRVFREASREDCTVVASVLTKIIDKRLLPYVATFLELDKSDWKTYEDQSRILRKCLSKTPSEAKQELAQITIRDALHVLERYDRIQYFAKKYATKALTLLRKAKVFKRPIRSFHSSEMHRIERSLYTFELYCFLYGRGSFDRTPFEEREAFFTQFAPWENEQLGSVLEFLVKELRPAFTEVAQHDIEFGEIPMFWVGEGDDVHWLHSFAVLGVEFLEKVTTASTYEERHRLLRKNLFVASSFPSLDSLLLGSNPIDILIGPQWLDDDAMSKLREGPSMFSKRDPDTGPAEIWFQAHKGDISSQYVVSESHEASREIAYVMMDISRKEAMASFDGPKKSAEWHPFDEEKFEDEYEEQIRSCKIREAIYNGGGRGWWSWKDST